VFIVDNQLSILLAEDDLISRRLIKILIEKFGHKVFVVENGRKAFEAYQTNQYDLILMDIQMPLMDGLECTKKIREFEQQINRSRVTIIAVTAHAMIGDKEKCLNAGMDDYITKPIEEKVLMEKIDKLRLNHSAILKTGNIELLNKLFDNTSDVREIITDFLGYYPRQLSLIKQKVKEKSFDEMAALVHKLKGSTSNFEAEKVVDILKKLEICASQCDQESIERLMLLLETELESLKNYLLKYQK